MICNLIFQIVVLLFALNNAAGLPSILRIGMKRLSLSSHVAQISIVPGAIFSEQEEEQETAFRFAIERINDDVNILPGTTLVAHVERVPASDSYTTERRRKKFVIDFMKHKIIFVCSLQYAEYRCCRNYWTNQ